MKFRFILFCFTFVLLTFVACKNEGETQRSDHGAHAEHAHSPEGTTIVKQAGPLQVSFDITSMQAHLELMKSMNMNTQHESQSSHYVMVTVLDANKKPVKDLPMKIKVMDPKGQSLKDPAGVPMDVMAGQGMVHYGQGFDLKTPGKHQVLVMFKYQDQVLSSGTEWELK